MVRLRLLAVPALAVAALLAVAAPAGASVSTTSSALGAGYRITPAAGVTSAKARFRVPSITCVDASRFDVLYLGVFGLNGTSQSTSYAEVFAACNMSLTPNYFAAAFTSGGGLQQLSIATGDDIVTRLDENGSHTHATVQDLTAKTSTSSSGASAMDASVLIGDFGNPTIPTFNRVRMNAAMVNGVPFADDPTPFVRERLKSQKPVQIGTSLAASGDTSFIMQFRSNT